MSAENVELVRGLIPSDGMDMVEATRLMTGAGVERVGIDSGPFAEDFEIEFISEQPLGPGPVNRRGVKGLAEGWANWLEPYESYLLTPEEFLDAGEEVVVLVHVRARTKRDGVEVEHSPAALFQVRDGKVRRTRFFLERELALEVAGLDPPPA